MDLLTAESPVGMPPAFATLLPRFIERILHAREPDATAIAALVEYASNFAQWSRRF
jgi:hypothetical protein